MDSLEKLQGLLAGTNDIVPEDAEQARYIQMLQTAGPFLGALIPDSAEEFDDLLLGLLGWTIRLRSDDADPTPATEVLARAFGTVKERAAAAGEPIAEPEA